MFMYAFIYKSLIKGDGKDGHSFSCLLSHFHEVEIMRPHEGFLALLLITSCSQTVEGKYHKVSSGKSCEESGFARIISQADCKNAPEGNFKGTLPKDMSTFGPGGCYLRHDGDVWYNPNEQSTKPCTSESICICKTGEHHFGCRFRLY